MRLARIIILYAQLIVNAYVSTPKGEYCSATRITLRRVRTRDYLELCLALLRVRQCVVTRSCVLFRVDVGIRCRHTRASSQILLIPTPLSDRQHYLVDILDFARALRALVCLSYTGLHYSLGSPKLQYKATSICLPRTMTIWPPAYHLLDRVPAVGLKSVVSMAFKLRPHSAWFVSVQSSC